MIRTRSMTHRDYMRHLHALNCQLTKIKNATYADLQKIFRQKSIPEIKEIIQSSNEGVLDFLSEISILTEDYEICEAVKLVKEENGIIN